MLDTRPLCNMDAELTVIQGVVACNEASGRILAEIKPEDFWIAGNRSVYESLAAANKNRQLLEYSLDITPVLPSKHIPLWDAVRCLQNLSARRNALAIISDVSAMVNDHSKSISDIQAKIKQLAIGSIDSRTCVMPERTDDGLTDFIDSLGDVKPAFLTGFATVDYQAPIMAGDFAILAARPAVGKSAIAIDAVAHNIALGSVGVMISGEMPSRQIYARVISKRTGVQLSKLISRSLSMTAGEAIAVKNEIGNLKDTMPERWLLPATASIEDVRQIVEIMRPAWLVVDYMQILRVKDRSRIFTTVDKLDWISMELRAIAQEHKCAIVGLAQLSRESAGEIPAMRHLKGSGQFEQDATHIFLLDRPESEQHAKQVERRYYSGSEIVPIYDPKKEETYNRAALIAAKNRNGMPFTTVLNFRPETASFTEYSRTYQY